MPQAESQHSGGRGRRSPVVYRVDSRPARSTESLPQNKQQTHQNLNKPPILLKAEAVLRLSPGCSCALSGPPSLLRAPLACLLSALGSSLATRPCDELWRSVPGGVGGTAPSSGQIQGVIFDKDRDEVSMGTSDPSVPTPLSRTIADCSPTRTSRIQTQIHLVTPATTVPMFPTMTRRTRMAMERETPVTTTWTGTVQAWGWGMAGRPRGEARSSAGRRRCRCRPSGGPRLIVTGPGT